MGGSRRRCAGPRLFGAQLALWLDRRAALGQSAARAVWAGHTLYPAIYPEDLKVEAQDFYRQFYRVGLDSEQIDALLP